MTVEFLNRFTPPGMDARRHRNAFITAVVISTVYCLFDFLSRFSGALNSLYIDWYDGRRELDELAQMTDFKVVLGPCLKLYFISAAAMLCFAVFSFLYLRQGSKSYYTLKRLPQSHEILKRTCVLPLLSAIILIVLAFIMLLLLFAVYMIFTPKPCLTAGQWEMIWRITK